MATRGGLDCAVWLAGTAFVLLAVVPGCRDAADPPGGAPAPVDDRLPWPAADEPALLALIASDGYELGEPVPLAITPDGAVLFRRAKPRDRSADLYQLDPAGTLTVLATAAQLTGSAGAPRGIDAIEVSDDGRRVLVPLAGRLFVIERATARARELAIGPHQDPRLSPDGTQVGFVRDGDLWVASIGASGPARYVRIAQHPADREYATPEPVAADLGRQRGYWWSPDSRSIIFQRTDARAVATRYLADPAHPEQRPAERKLAHSGSPNATVDLGIVSIRGGAPRWVSWDLARYPYLARVIWPVRGALTLVVMNREQTQLAALAVDPATGATRPLVVDRDPAWINIAPDPLTWLPDGSGFLWMTERRGAWSLERYAADGAALGPALMPDVGLRRVAGLSADGRDVIIEATSDPREQHVWRAPITGGPATALTSGGGVHRVQTGHGVLVIRSANRAGGQRTTVVRAGGPSVELPSVAEHPKSAATTELETLTLEDHLQYAAVTRPHGFDPKVRYPVVLRISSEPNSNAVVDARDTYAADQWCADAGFIVVRTDGRGTPGRDRLWQRVIAGDALTLPMNDQIAALKQLGAHHPELDLARVGAIGADLGGYLAAVGVSIHPDVFAAAVAVSPITDWELLDTAYGERYMRTPTTNPEGYRRTNASTYAEQLTRPLLVMSRVTDDRLGFAHTMELVGALSAAGKRVELAVLPETGHPRDLARELAAVRLALDFLRNHLGPPVRPAVMPAPRSEEEEEERERQRDRPDGGRPGHR